MYTTNVSVNEPCCREHVCTAEIKTNARGISTYTFKDLKEDCGKTIPFSLYRPVGHLPIIPLIDREQRIGRRSKGNQGLLQHDERFELVETEIFSTHLLSKIFHHE